jgi:hypothetical protein
VDALFHPVLNRGIPPAAFIVELIAWGKSASGEIFAPNPNPSDVYALVKSHLATRRGEDAGGRPVFLWDDLQHRRAAMLEVMRVHAGFESSWNWKEGVDRANRTSMAHIEGEETGAWQVSYDSVHLGDDAMLHFAQTAGIATPEAFIPAMKTRHALAMEYYARLVRVSIAWAGPLISRKILPELRLDALAEFRLALE